MKQFLLLLSFSLILFACTKQAKKDITEEAFYAKGKNKTTVALVAGPEIKLVFPETGDFAIYRSSVNFCPHVTVSSPKGIYGTVITIDPSGPLSWNPEFNIGKYAMGVFIHGSSDVSKCFNISGLEPGEHTWQVDVWDMEKNQTTQTYKLTVY